MNHVDKRWGGQRGMQHTVTQLAHTCLLTSHGNQQVQPAHLLIFRAILAWGCKRGKGQAEGRA